MGLSRLPASLLRSSLCPTSKAILQHRCFQVTHHLPKVQVVKDKGIMFLRAPALQQKIFKNIKALESKKKKKLKVKAKVKASPASELDSKSNSISFPSKAEIACSLLEPQMKELLCSQGPCSQHYIHFQMLESSMRSERSKAPSLSPLHSSLRNVSHGTEVNIVFLFLSFLKQRMS